MNEVTENPPAFWELKLTVKGAVEIKQILRGGAAIRPLGGSPVHNALLLKAQVGGDCSVSVGRRLLCLCWTATALSLLVGYSRVSPLDARTTFAHGLMLSLESTRSRIVFQPRLLISGPQGPLMALSTNNLAALI